MAKKQYLWIWDDVLTDYSSGIMFAIAPTAEEAREIIVVEKFELVSKNVTLKLYRMYRQNKDQYIGRGQFTESEWKDLDNKPKKYRVDRKGAARIIFGGS